MLINGSFLRYVHAKWSVIFFYSSILTHIKEVYIMALLHILVKLFGGVGVIILLLMILTAFLGLCFTLGSNELLGRYCYFTNLSTAIPIIRKRLGVFYLGA